MQILSRHFRFSLSIIAALIVLIIMGMAFKPITYYQDGVSILIYHDINNVRKGGDTITDSLFKKQLLFLKNKGFTYITYQQFKKFLSGGPVQKNAVLVTFDDGYENYYTNAYPIMKAMAVPSVQFVITKDLKYPQLSHIPSLSEEEIRSMTQNGDLVEVQSHTDNLHSKQDDNAYITHRLMINGRLELNKEFEHRVTSDIQASILKLASLQAYPVDSLAYPFGIYNAESIELLKKSGIHYAYTVQPGIADRSSARYEIPRINAGSPWITPFNLLKRITNQTLTFKEPLDLLPIRGVLEQVGGTVEAGEKGQINLFFANQIWSLTRNKLAVNKNGQTVELSQGLIIKSKKAYITYPDLRKLYGSLIQYDAVKQRFYPGSSLSME